MSVKLASIDCSSIDSICRVCIKCPLLSSSAPVPRQQTDFLGSVMALSAVCQEVAGHADFLQLFDGILQLFDSLGISGIDNTTSKSQKKESKGADG